MKKILFKGLAVVALGVVMISNLKVSANNDNSISLSSVANTANAQSEDPFTKACDSWCYHQGYVCWLVLSTGADLYCYGWDEPF